MAALPKRRRPGPPLLAAFAALFSLAAGLLVLAAVNTGRWELHQQLAQLGGLADLAATSAGAPEAPQQQQQQQQQERWPPLPPGEPPAQAAGGDEDDFEYADPYADIRERQAARQRGGGGGKPAATAGGGGGNPATAGPKATEPPCSEVLGVRKVALLFLTTRRLAHEKLWRLWMWDAAGLLPRQALPVVRASVCGPEAAVAPTWQRIRRACPQEPLTVTAAGVTTELPRQHLFSIYVHAPPDYKGLEYQPLFLNHVIPTRLKTWWGDISILDAERALLREALKDPLNHKFALISDSDIPLYDPLTFYQQLLWEDRSRVRACASGWMNRDRWRDDMATSSMRGEHWRKSNQFFALTRRHAELVVSDTEAYTSFKTKCGGWYSHLNVWKECIADEHYIPTLMAAAGLDGEGYCEGWGLAYTDWSEGGQHPKSFQPKDITPDLIKHMRWRCNNMREAVQDSQHMFVPLGPLLTANSSQQACQQVEATLASGSSSSSPVEAGDSGNSTAGSTTYARPLHGKCPLTARKFPPFTALRARQLFAASCPAGSGGLAESKAAQAFPVPRDPDVALLRGQACREEVQKQVLALNPGPGGMVGAAARRLLCARRAGGSGGWWRRALADEWGDALEAWCSAP